MIYFLEDDSSIRELVIYTLLQSGMDAKGFEKPSLFWKAMATKKPDLLLLDIMLPEESGLEVLKKIRNHPETSHLPVIMLTAKDSEYDKVVGLDSGADDYLSKPFGMMELTARIRAMLRRTKGGEPKDYHFKDLYISPARHVVRVQDEEVNLTYKEFEVLQLLMENRGIVFTRQQLLDRIWGYDFDGETRTVDVHIRTLRQKLKECGSYIETIRGVGYRMGGDEG